MARRYENVYRKDRTYISDDKLLIRELQKLLKKSKVSPADLAMVDPKSERITFCNVMQESNGFIYNCYLDIYEDY